MADRLLINEIIFLNVFFHVEPEYEVCFSLTITVFDVEGYKHYFQPCILDFARNEVSGQTIYNCFNKCGFKTLIIQYVLQPLIYMPILGFIQFLFGTNS